ncbi:flagellar basal-body rod protein FlgF/flagellar basal-body rod protein FlgG [Bryocella elongata]|uniref:Flagellar basal-body rod protein FlgF/flagellar basal-body rod protein FlgG n=1 Tax=Bryocella elongata TaxID=863522 RepID=A0A1H5TLW4_9BACT|nr:flagellar basal-body rod protein FlgF [Bryocella elongata]SEF63091.1 flagellar basal-body rod protein FlgF/flagellar basal-body rod protein FlgG [Bryocella elongata]
MNSGLYAAATALVSRTDALDAVANNLANQSTPGFRARHSTFRATLAQHGNPNLSMLNEDANDYGVLGGTRLDTTQGSLTKTGNPLDIAIEGQGYFQVQTAQGTVYTRAGNFSVSAQGQLVTANGDPVLGEGGAPISIVGQPVSISSDGTISVNGATAGKLGVVDFPANVDLESMGNNYLKAPANTTPAATTATLRQGMIEGSNVNPISGVVELIDAQRSVEEMRRMLSLFSNEMDKTASQDLPHVGQ